MGFKYHLNICGNFVILFSSFTWVALSLQPAVITATGYLQFFY